jgi:hypothetical protein
VATEAALPSVQGDPKSFEAFRQVRARMERVTFADMDRETWHFARPPVQGLDFEVDVRGVSHELVI